jgi:hypothetical protein
LSDCRAVQGKLSVFAIQEVVHAVRDALVSERGALLDDIGALTSALTLEGGATAAAAAASAQPPPPLAHLRAFASKLQAREQGRVQTTFAIA